ncbi:hypothetical protein C7M84_023523 [Penaeus vannamei]|uniref:Uncharacterized protein n=1 Tax=Penaeus vannamei TaxID=6689 RepID=A0A3R7MI85_PENVA|nr:hypothetical protein C7M84_023523 [Penaeus vannamei]
MQAECPSLVKEEAQPVVKQSELIESQKVAESQKSIDELFDQLANDAVEDIERFSELVESPEVKKGTSKTIARIASEESLGDTDSAISTGPSKTASVPSKPSVLADLEGIEYMDTGGESASSPEEVSHIKEGYTKLGAETPTTPVAPQISMVGMENLSGCDSKSSDSTKNSPEEAKDIPEEPRSISEPPSLSESKPKFSSEQRRDSLDDYVTKSRYEGYIPRFKERSSVISGEFAGEVDTPVNGSTDNLTNGEVPEKKTIRADCKNLQDSVLGSGSKRSISEVSGDLPDSGQTFQAEENRSKVRVGALFRDDSVLGTVGKHGSLQDVNVPFADDSQDEEVFVLKEDEKNIIVSTKKVPKSPRKEKSPRKSSPIKEVPSPSHNNLPATPLTHPEQFDQPCPNESCSRCLTTIAPTPPPRTQHAASLKGMYTPIGVERPVSTPNLSTVEREKSGKRLGFVPN